VKEEEHLYQISYERKESIFSDHRPVLAYFCLTTYQHDKILMEEMRERMLNHNRQKSKATAEATDAYFSDIISEMRVNPNEKKQRRGATISKGVNPGLVDEEMKMDMLQRRSH